MAAATSDRYRVPPHARTRAKSTTFFAHPYPKPRSWSDRERALQKLAKCCKWRYAFSAKNAAKRRAAGTAPAAHEAKRPHREVAQMTRGRIIPPVLSFAAILGSAQQQPSQACRQGVEAMASMLQTPGDEKIYGYNFGGLVLAVTLPNFVKTWPTFGRVLSSNFC